MLVNFVKLRSSALKQRESRIPSGPWHRLLFSSILSSFEVLIIAITSVLTVESTSRLEAAEHTKTTDWTVTTSSQTWRR